MAPLTLLLTVLFAAAKHSRHHEGAAHEASCPRDEAKAVVLGLQAELEHALQNCNILRARELSLPRGSFATVDAYCGPAGTCCVDMGSLDDLWAYYSCADTILYPAKPSHMDVLRNGTVVVTRSELSKGMADPMAPVSYAYEYRWNWHPVKGKHCEYRLGYVAGHAYGCPAVLPNAISCAAPICAPFA